MNLLMLTPSFAPAVGGVETHLRRVCEELLALGHQPVVVTRRTSPDWPPQEQIVGVSVHRLPARPGLRALCSTLEPLLEQADVVHAHDAYPMLRWYLPIRWRAPRRPAFITFHGYEGYPIPLQARVLRRLAARAALGSICMGEFICKWYRYRCDVVSYGGVDAPAHVADPAADAGAVFIGRLEPDTGVTQIVEALGLLRARHGRSLRLTICGDGSLRPRLESAARSAGIEAEFTGRVPDPRPYLLQARFAFVTGYLAILEAMACRRLVLSIYDNPLKRDYLELFPARDAIVIAGSPADLAARIAQHLEGPDPQMLDRAQAFAREQTWRRVAETYLRLYADHGVAV